MKAGLNRSVYDFSIDYDTLDVDDIWNIRMYSMRKFVKYKWNLQMRPEMININSNKPLVCRYSK